MNAITTRQTGLVPTLSEPLQRATEECIDRVIGDGDGKMLIRATRAPTEDEIEAANVALATLERAPLVSLKLAERWLRAFFAGRAGAPKTDEGYQSEAADLTLVLGNVPAAALTKELAAEILRTHDFFPSPAKVAALADAAAQPWRDQKARLRMLLSAGKRRPWDWPEDVRQGPPDAAEKAAVRARVAEMTARLGGEAA